MSKSDRNTYELYWEGPFSKRQIKESPQNKNWKLYAIYTPHPLYGPNALVYIGMAKNGALERIESHSARWFDQRNIGGKIYVASVTKFETWENSPDWDSYEDCLKNGKDVPKIVSDLEALLIYALQPTYNTINKKSATIPNNLRIFNTGKIGAIPYELSAEYHLGQ